MEKQNKVSKKLFLSLFLLTITIATAQITLQTKNPNNEGTVIYLHELESIRSAGSATLDELTKSGNVIVIFYEDWCPPCQRMTPIFEQVAQEMNTILFVKVKREFYRSIFNHYNLSTVPAILFFHNGTLVKIQPSSLNKKELTKLIKKIYNT